MSEVPQHYQLPGGGDLVSQWRRRYSPETFQAICLTHVERYLTRYRMKDGIRDLSKAADYANWMAESFLAETMAARAPKTPLGRFYGGRGADVFAEVDVSLSGDLIHLQGCSDLDLTPQEAVRLCRTLINAIKKVSPDMGEWTPMALGDD